MAANNNINPPAASYVFDKADPQNIVFIPKTDQNVELIRIGPAKINPDNYSIAEDGAITFPANYLSTLNPGEKRITIQFADQSTIIIQIVVQDG